MKQWTVIKKEAEIINIHVNLQNIT